MNGLEGVARGRGGKQRHLAGVYLRTPGAAGWGSIIMGDLGREGKCIAG